MIKITVDKQSELVWMNEVLSSGMTHISCPYTLKAFGVSKKQSIQYDPSETYVDDIKEEREAVNRRFGHIPWDVRERILRKEYEENMVQPKETKRNILVGPWCKGEAYD